MPRAHNTSGRKWRLSEGKKGTTSDGSDVSPGDFALNQKIKLETFDIAENNKIGVGNHQCTSEPSMTSKHTSLLFSFPCSIDVKNAFVSIWLLMGRRALLVIQYIWDIE